MTTVAFVFVIFKILISFKIKVKEYNPIFNETILLFFKLYVSFQAYVISLKIEDIIDWEWHHIFWPTYIFLLFLTLATLGLFLILLSKCWIKLRRRNQKLTEIVGLIWLLSFLIGLTITSVLFIRSFIKLQEEKDESYFTTVLFFSITFLGIMLFYTLIEWNSINKFVYDIAVIVEQDEEEDIEYVMSENPQQQKKLKNKQKKIKTINPTEQNEQKNIPFFLQKLSSTYFSAIANKNPQSKQSPTRDAKNKNIPERKAQQRQKSQSFMIQKYELKSSIDFSEKPKIANLDQIQKEKLNNQKNKWQQIASDATKKFQSVIEAPLKKQTNKNDKRKNQMNNNDSPKNNQLSKSHMQNYGGTHNDFSSNKKIEQSIIEDKDIQVNVPNLNDQTSTTCVICFDNAPDSVYMPCGHGGVCYECSVDIMRNTGECYLCRDAIKEILRLDIKDKAQNNNYRVIALTTMVDESIIDPNQKKLDDLE